MTLETRESRVGVGGGDGEWCQDDETQLFSIDLGKREMDGDVMRCDVAFCVGLSTVLGEKRSHDEAHRGVRVEMPVVLGLGWSRKGDGVGMCRRTFCGQLFHYLLKVEISC